MEKNKCKKAQPEISDSNHSEDELLEPGSDIQRIREKREALNQVIERMIKNINGTAINNTETKF